MDDRATGPPFVRFRVFWLIPSPIPCRVIVRRAASLRDFGLDSAQGRQRVGGASDGAPDDQIVRAGCNGLARRGDAVLVIPRRCCRPDPGRYQAEFTPEPRAQGGSLLCRAHDAVKPALPCEP